MDLLSCNFLSQNSLLASSVFHFFHVPLLKTAVLMLAMFNRNGLIDVFILRVLGLHVSMFLGGLGVVWLVVR